MRSLVICAVLFPSLMISQLFQSSIKIGGFEDRVIHSKDVVRGMSIKLEAKFGEFNSSRFIYGLGYEINSIKPLTHKLENLVFEGDYNGFATLKKDISSSFGTLSLGYSLMPKYWAIHIPLSVGVQRKEYALTYELYDGQTIKEEHLVEDADANLNQDQFYSEKSTGIGTGLELDLFYDFPISLQVGLRYNRFKYNQYHDITSASIINNQVEVPQMNNHVYSTFGTYVGIKIDVIKSIKYLANNPPSYSEKRPITRTPSSESKTYSDRTVKKPTSTPKKKKPSVKLTPKKPHPKLKK